MAEDNGMILAKKVYSDFCTVLEKRNWSYTKEEDELIIRFGVSGDDIPMEFCIVVDAGRQLVRLFSALSFRVPEDKAMDLAIATCVVTNGIFDGSFDFDISKGLIAFRLTASFKDSKLGEGLFDHMIDYSSYMVDKYNDKFFALCKGFISIEDFISQLNS